MSFIDHLSSILTNVGDFDQLEEVNKSLKKEVGNLRVAKDETERKFRNLRDSHDSLMTSLRLQKEKNDHQKKEYEKLEKLKDDLHNQCNVNYNAYHQQKDNVDTLRHNLDIERRAYQDIKKKYDSIVNLVNDKPKVIDLRHVKLEEPKVEVKVEDPKPKEDFKSRMENRFSPGRGAILTKEEQRKEEEKNKSDVIYKELNHRVLRGVPGGKRILAHILHPATDPIRTNDSGIGIYFVETYDGKIFRAHESKDRKEFGKLELIEEHLSLQDAIDYCHMMFDNYGYYTVHSYCDEFPKSDIPLKEEIKKAQDEFISWKVRGPAFDESDEDIEF